MLKTILVADDDPQNAKVIINYFKKYNQDYEILYTPNGKIACKVATQKIPNLIILDWIMPVMNGLEALIYLKKQEQTSHIPIIIATGTMLEDIHLSEALERGAIDYLRKPISPLELVARTRSALSLSESHYREKELMQTIIDHKTRELTSNTIQLVNKNEVLLQIKNLLGQSLSSDKIKKVQKLIKSNINLDAQWDKFKIHFEQVHPNFFAKMQKSLPQLNENELRLCAYIKMRLGNKEIANLLNLSVKGMESARYRLKKHLSLSPKDDLNEFVRGI